LTLMIYVKNKLERELLLPIQVRVSLWSLSEWPLGDVS
jgi:hypothetical protein